MIRPLPLRDEPNPIPGAKTLRIRVGKANVRVDHGQTDASADAGGGQTYLRLIADTSEGTIGHFWQDCGQREWRAFLLGLSEDYIAHTLLPHCVPRKDYPLTRRHMKERLAEAGAVGRLPWPVIEDLTARIDATDLFTARSENGFLKADDLLHEITERAGVYSAADGWAPPVLQMSQDPGRERLLEGFWRPLCRGLRQTLRREAEAPQSKAPEPASKARDVEPL